MIIIRMRIFYKKMRIRHFSQIYSFIDFVVLIISLKLNHVWLNIKLGPLWLSFFSFIRCRVSEFFSRKIIRFWLGDCHSNLFSWKHFQQGILFHIIIYLVLRNMRRDKDVKKTSLSIFTSEEKCLRLYRVKSSRLSDKHHFI